MKTVKTYFRQSCPVCGRPLNVPIKLMGCEVSCKHCFGAFTANGCEADEQYGAAMLSWNSQALAKDCQDRKVANLQRRIALIPMLKLFAGSEFA